MSSVGLDLFHRLCEIADGLEIVREAAVPATDTWTSLSDLLWLLDGAIDALVHSQGLGGADDDA